MRLLLLALATLSLLSSTLSSRPNPCTQVPASGPCEALFPKWFFDNTVGRCRKFIWGGCHGSIPFHTRRACKLAKCVRLPLPSPSPLSSKTRCVLEPRRGPCPRFIKRWWFDPKSKKCTSFSWGGCFGTIPFRTRRQCLRARCKPLDPCKQMPDIGPCRARFIRWFFDPVAKRCKSFVWGGCKGSVPFETREACENKCPVDDDCIKKPDVGPCDAAIRRYFYNPRTRKCESFGWGGCGGTVPFVTLKECQDRKCRCSQIPEIGPCKALFMKWFFDEETRQCEKFIYGGCKGSVPFDTEDMCLRARC